MDKLRCTDGYIFPWDEDEKTFVQLVDGSIAALNTKNHKYYWLYFPREDRERSNPVHILEMSQGEYDELDNIDILKDIADANQKGMYPQVSDEIKEILYERSVRRDVVFMLNRLDSRIISENPGIVYIISRKALTLLKDGEQQQDAVSKAIIYVINREYKNEV